MTSDLLEKELTSWCASYVDAFNRYDAEKIGEHWSFPSLVIHDGQRATFKSADHFLPNTSALLNFYKRQHVNKVERELIDCMVASTDTAFMTVHDKMFGEQEGCLVEWDAAYLLQRKDEVWRAVCAVADGEVSAWQARGTPLGS